MLDKKVRPTLKSISQLTGLAVPTVSRALGNAPDISKTTRQRVQKVAKEIGYVPNRAGVRLRTGRSYVVSLVLSTETDVMNLTAKLINSIASGLRGTRYNLTITPVLPDEDPLVIIESIVQNQAADVIILNQTQPDDPRIAYLKSQNFPFVTHGRTGIEDRHDYFDFDNRVCAALAVERMAARGRKNLLLLAPPANQFYASEMIAGATEAADRLNVALSLMENVTSDSASEEIIQALKSYLSAEDGHADGVICGSSTSCMASVAAVEDLGLVVGSDIDLFSKEAVPFLKRFRKGILTFYEDVSEAGAFLAKAAVRRVEQPDEQPMQKVAVPSD